MEKYPLERFACLLDTASHRTDNNAPFPHLADGESSQYAIFSRPRKKKVSLTSLPSSKLYEPSCIGPIAEQCGQVRHFREMKGCIPEPLWKANLWLAAFCKDGDRFARDWSSGYEGYTFEETQAALDRGREYGPTTCEKFHSVKADICEACPYWAARNFKSPIVLGKGKAEPAGNEQVAPPKKRWTGSVPRREL